MASGCPVVGTDVGATPELLAPFEPRLIAARAAPTELAVTIRWALEHLDDAARSRCAEYARDRFDWERVIVGWENALEETVSRTSR
jgi:glycosyltransferase involved in cell wall biosynthesis